MTERRSPSFQPSSLEAIRAIRELRKTQTRRVLTVRIGGIWTLPYEPYYAENDGQLFCMDEYGDYHEAAEWLSLRYGEPGTVWALCEPLRRHKTNIAVYLDGTMAIDRRPDTRHVDISWEWNRDTLSAMFMPRWAARDFVTLEDVRVERLQNISDEDAIAEGIRWYAHDDEGGHWEVDVPKGTKNVESGLLQTDDPIEAFAYLWDSINGKKVPWKADPWVTAYTFGNYQRDPGRVMQENKP